MSHQDDDTGYPYDSNPQLRTSYLSSCSVPSTPPLLSHSRSASHVRLPRRSKSPARVPLSDTNLASVDASRPLHHQGGGSGRKRSASSHPRLAETAGRQDSEWLLRAGLALATSTREEKGQSWLAKRESSTSLVSEQENQAELPSQVRRSRSGRSTPAVRSRHGSRSRAGSGRGSRVDLSMTAIEGAPTRQYQSRKPSIGSDSHDMIPDFVDDHARAEVAAMYGHHQGSMREEDPSFSDSEPDSEQIDEVELQRLTRERGFGLGSWIDRLVEWTLFSVEEEWATPSAQTVQHDAAGETNGSGEGGDGEDPERKTEDTEDDSSSATGEYEPPAVVEKPGEKGGWEDVGWLFRVVKGSLL